MRFEGGKAMKKNLRDGSILGVLLLIYNLALLRLFIDSKYRAFILDYFLLLLAGFWLLGIVLMCIHRRKTRIDRNLYYGPAGLYWLIPLGFGLCLFRIAGPWAEWLLYCNLGALFAAWLVEYLYLVRMSEKLNGARGAVRRSLAISLTRKVRQPEMVYDFLESYCENNHMDLTILERDIPGRARIDGTEYGIEVQEYYGFFGMPAYDLLITSLTEGS